MLFVTKAIDNPHYYLNQFITTSNNKFFTDEKELEYYQTFNKQPLEEAYFNYLNQAYNENLSNRQHILYNFILKEISYENFLAEITVLKELVEAHKKNKKLKNPFTYTTPYKETKSFANARNYILYKINFYLTGLDNYNAEEYQEIVTYIENMVTNEWGLKDHSRKAKLPNTFNANFDTTQKTYFKYNHSNITDPISLVIYALTNDNPLQTVFSNATGTKELTVSIMPGIPGKEEEINDINTTIIQDYYDDIVNFLYLTAAELCRVNHNNILSICDVNIAIEWYLAEFYDLTEEEKIKKPKYFRLKKHRILTEKINPTLDILHHLSYLGTIHTTGKYSKDYNFKKRTHLFTDISDDYNQNGAITFTFNETIAQILLDSPISFLPIQVLALNGKKRNAKSLGIYLSQRYSNNKNQERNTHNIIQVKTLINKYGINTSSITRNWQSYTKDFLERQFNTLLDEKILSNWNYCLSLHNQLPDDYFYNHKLSLKEYLTLFIEYEFIDLPMYKTITSSTKNTTRNKKTTTKNSTTTNNITSKDELDHLYDV